MKTGFLVRLTITAPDLLVFKCPSFSCSPVSNIRSVFGWPSPFPSVSRLSSGSDCPAIRERSAASIPARHSILITRLTTGALRVLHTNRRLLHPPYPSLPVPLSRTRPPSGGIPFRCGGVVARPGVARLPSEAPQHDLLAPRRLSPSGGTFYDPFRPVSRRRSRR